MSWKDALAALQENIWGAGPQGNLTYVPYYERRRLTEDEWQQVKDIVAENGLALRMVNCCMGFGCGIEVYEPPAYPGLPATFWLMVTQDHLPLPHEGASMRFDEAWEVFHPLTHTEANTKLLEISGIEKPKSKGSYEY